MSSTVKTQGIQVSNILQAIGLLMVLAFTYFGSLYLIGLEGQLSGQPCCRRICCYCPSTGRSWNDTSKIPGKK